MVGEQLVRKLSGRLFRAGAGADTDIAGAIARSQADPERPQAGALPSLCHRQQSRIRPGPRRSGAACNPRRCLGIPGHPINSLQCRDLELRDHDQSPPACAEPVHLSRRSSRGGLGVTRIRRRTACSTSAIIRISRSAPNSRSLMRYSLPMGRHWRTILRYAARPRVEPITWLSAIAAVTSRIGLIATASTTYLEPYEPARLFASLDHISGGRAGWNIVTTSAPQAGAEFRPCQSIRRTTSVTSGRRSSWISSPSSGTVGKTTRWWPIRRRGSLPMPTRSIRSITLGKHFRVRGPLNVARSPRGRPVYVQAGSSEDGRAFAARFAEAIFTAHRDTRQRAGVLRGHRRSRRGRSIAIRSMSGYCPASARSSAAPRPKRSDSSRSSMI